MWSDNQTSQYTNILDALDETLAELKKADMNYGLTSMQEQSFVQLREIYVLMTNDALKLDSQFEACESLN